MAPHLLSAALAAAGSVVGPLSLLPYSVGFLRFKDVPQFMQLTHACCAQVHLPGAASQQGSVKGHLDAAAGLLPGEAARDPAVLYLFVAPVAA